MKMTVLSIVSEVLAVTIDDTVPFDQEMALLCDVSFKTM
jgi:hypothetical protein